MTQAYPQDHCFRRKRHRCGFPCARRREREAGTVGDQREIFWSTPTAAQSSARSRHVANHAGIGAVAHLDRAGGEDRLPRNEPSLGNRATIGTTYRSHRRRALRRGVPCGHSISDRSAVVGRFAAYPIETILGATTARYPHNCAASMLRLLKISVDCGAC